jgi:hypothetical protein
MSKTIGLTIAIVSSRPTMVLKCLESIKSQSYQPKNILLIKNLNLSIPQKRNLALKKCRTPYLAFIDDDCILNPNWIKFAYQSIVSQPNITFVVGKTELLNDSSKIAQIQFFKYQKWFSQSYPLDTKNVIFRLSKIKKIRFDTKFRIFEDVDFNLQLKSAGLLGSYCPKMSLKHPEITNLFKIIIKNFNRGIYKSKINTKWGNFDNYTPSISRFTNIIDFLTTIFFNLGYVTHPPHLITIVNHLDRGANEQRLKSFQEFFKQQHYSPSIINTQTEFLKVVASRRYFFRYGLAWLKYRQNKNSLINTITLKAKILNYLLAKNHTSLAIIQNPEDMATILTKHRYQTLYDSPTIYYQELALSQDYNSTIINKIKKIETKVYQQSTFVSFHWYTYFNLAKKYKLKVHNPIILNWTCPSVVTTAKFSPSPKIIHLGKLNSYWVNPQLLTTLSQKKSIDIYSYEAPNRNYYKNKLNYCGFLTQETKISEYQFGLITLSTDDLRSHGFSAKYLHYLSYGLPVLCPKWRHDPLLSSATIYYDELNFNEQIKKYSQPKFWRQKHLAALKISQKLSPTNNLAPLKNLLSFSNVSSSPKTS